MSEPEQVNPARDAAVDALVREGISLIALLLIMASISRRDWLAQQRIRLEQFVDCRLHRDDAAAAVAALQRDISRIEHGDHPPLPRREPLSPGHLGYPMRILLGPFHLDRGGRFIRPEHTYPDWWRHTDGQ